jgi:hypothetical protein
MIPVITNMTKFYKIEATTETEKFILFEGCETELYERAIGEVLDIWDGIDTVAVDERIYDIIKLKTFIDGVEKSIYLK